MQNGNHLLLKEPCEGARESFAVCAQDAQGRGSGVMDRGDNSLGQRWDKLIPQVTPALGVLDLRAGFPSSLLSNGERGEKRVFECK